MDRTAECPIEAGFAMPAEWAAHTRTWMCWPCRLEAWGSPEAMLAARVATATVARAIAAFEPVIVVARPGDGAEARLALGGGISVREIPIDDSWARDAGPSFVTDGRGGLGAVDWVFNAWGTKFHPHAADAALGAAIARAAGARTFASPLVCEGGAVHVDGEGTLLTTEQCLLNANRNPERTRGEVEGLLAAALGVRRVIWLGEGFADVETDGHVDNIACFAGPGRVIVGVPDATGHPDAAPVREAIRRLRAARDALGRAFEVIELKQPRHIRRRHDGTIAPWSYVNFYLCNGGLILPVFDDPNDAAAQALLEELFPGRRIVTVDGRAIAEGGGGVHCITQQEPAP